MSQRPTININNVDAIQMRQEVVSRMSGSRIKKNLCTKIVEFITRRGRINDMRELLQMQEFSGQQIGFDEITSIFHADDPVKEANRIAEKNAEIALLKKHKDEKDKEIMEKQMQERAILDEKEKQERQMLLETQRLQKLEADKEETFQRKLLQIQSQLEKRKRENQILEERVNKLEKLAAIEKELEAETLRKENLEKKLSEMETALL
jgi:hypothetical protein